MGRTAMLRHTVERLPKSDWSKSDAPLFIIPIEDVHTKMFGMLVLARHDAEFSDLDRLLRDALNAGYLPPGNFRSHFFSVH